MASLNKVFLLGNLTRDPELRTTTSGTPVCRFTVAVNRQMRNSDGSTREEVVFVEVDSFGKSAETIARYMAKGRPILIEGRLRLDQWETQSGEKRSRLMVVTDSFQFVSSQRGEDGRDGGNGPGQRGGQGRGRFQRQEERQEEEEGPDGEIPF
ncbi:MAG: single-stranded DNA-binding protein [Puniceicoccales bacterium]|jgi:single-strand DNA-binding protein|nr:single-stranded DNA-binding protein [Puniceicoccales bacterium]